MIKLPIASTTTIRFGVLVSAIVFAEALSAQDGPSAQRLLPTGGEIGVTHEVTVSGKFPTWPVQVWSETSDLTIQPSDESGKLNVTVAPDAQPGVRYFRLFNDKGATRLLPFMVDRCADILEEEPNDHHRRAQRIGGLPVAIHGHLAKNGDVDTYAVNLKNGQTLVASVDAQRFLGSPMDADLQILTPTGIVLVQQFDHHGLDPELIFTAAEDGEYLIRVLAFPETPNSTIAYAGGENFSYRLVVTTGGYLRHAIPSALSRSTENRLTLVGLNLDQTELVLPATEDANRTSLWLGPSGMQGMIELPVTSDEILVESVSGESTQPMLIAVPSIVTGAIQNAGEQDRYKFSSEANKRWKIAVDARAIGSRLDTVLEIDNAEGKQLATNDDASGNRDSQLSFVVPADGDYTIGIRDMHRDGGPQHWYRLRIEAELPFYRLSTPTDAIVGKLNTPIEIVVDVQRVNGFSDDITVVLVDASSEPLHAETISKSGDESAKQIKLVVQSDRPFSGPVRIAGRSPNSEQQYARPGAAPVEWLWLTIVE